MIPKLEALREAIDAAYPEDAVEELKRMVAALTREVSAANGALTAKMDIIRGDLVDVGERVTRLEEREKACAEGNILGHRALWKDIDALKLDAKEREKETYRGRRSMIAAIVAAVGAVAAASVSIFR